MLLFRCNVASNLHRSRSPQAPSIPKTCRKCLFLRHPLLVVCFDVFLSPWPQAVSFSGLEQLLARVARLPQLLAGLWRAAMLLELAPSGGGTTSFSPTSLEGSASLSSDSLASSKASNLAGQSAMCVPPTKWHPKHYGVAPNLSMIARVRYLRAIRAASTVPAFGFQDVQMILLKDSWTTSKSQHVERRSEQCVSQPCFVCAGVLAKPDGSLPFELRLVVAKSFAC